MIIVHSLPFHIRFAAGVVGGVEAVVNGADGKVVPTSFGIQRQVKSTFTVASGMGRTAVTSPISFWQRHDVERPFSRSRKAFVAARFCRSA